MELKLRKLASCLRTGRRGLAILAVLMVGFLLMASVVQAEGEIRHPSYRPCTEYVVEMDGRICLLSRDTGEVIDCLTKGVQPDYIYDKIVFSDGDIGVIDISIGEVEWLTLSTVDDRNPVWSPDSSQIAFDSDRDGERGIYVMKPDGSDIIRLSSWDVVSDSDPNWHPYGTHIAFVSERDGNQEIYVMRVDGSEQTRLTNHWAVDHSPAWSTDGEHIAFVSNRDGSSVVYVMKPDGSDLRRVGGGIDPYWMRAETLLWVNKGQIIEEILNFAFLPLASLTPSFPPVPTPTVSPTRYHPRFRKR